ncbi:MAG: hypothetical protein LBG47_00855 [Prevotellaceae bacterium]|nr:hypothetical protein [Prevotellaceae bacterium]
MISDINALIVNIVNSNCAKLMHYRRLLALLVLASLPLFASLPAARLVYGGFFTVFTTSKIPKEMMPLHPVFFGVGDAVPMEFWLSQI